MHHVYTKLEEAATTLQQAGLTYRLIDMYCTLFDWDKCVLFCN